MHPGDEALLGPPHANARARLCQPRVVTTTSGTDNRSPGRRLVLASASLGRLALMRNAGLEPAVIVSGADETDLGTDDPRHVVATLAERKAATVAASVRASASDALVVGCDSLLHVAGELHGKPISPAQAAAWWRAMRATEGDLLTGHCVIDAATGSKASDVAVTTVRFGSPTDDEIDAYVASTEPMHVAGAFTLDGRSAPFIDGIVGDAGNVIGLSLPVLRRLLAQLGVGITDLWR